MMSPAKVRSLFTNGSERIVSRCLTIPTKFCATICCKIGSAGQSLAEQGEFLHFGDRPASRVLKNAGNRLLTRAALKVADDCKELTEPRP
jgi:hypothetical protein